MNIYVFDQNRNTENKPLGYGLYTSVIVAENEEQAWEILLKSHPSKKFQWDFDTFSVDQPGEIAVCIE